MPSTATLGAVVTMLSPAGVRVGDRIWLYDIFLRIADLRATQDGAGRVLIFEGRDPFVMRGRMAVCRQIERSSTGMR
ncbi:hypothetical protein IAG44_22125 [Streptomyces roseirectus]|uniref:Uncharacterized protein n=1 Tax=Streptomyces roseirectus TaxID=2768066 RepID=A0A7H0IGC8_9ACTN|nr:hypothetical protein [Streptomyces roseirectus]QNP71844.1 hypothetical protein IAG44_22125 [Streptomyces roseirectus]